MTPQGASLEAARCLQCYDAPCTQACPAHIDVPGFIAAIRSGNVAGAAEIVVASNVMANVCGAICPEEIFCQSVCTRAKQDEPILIRELHFHATQAAGLPPERALPRNGRRIAVVGGGPAGIGCAMELARFGYGVTIFDKNGPGGIPKASIPSFRLPAEILDADVGLLRRHVGVKREEVTPAGLGPLTRKFDAVFLGIGLGTDRKAGIPGEELKGVLPVLRFLEGAKSGKGRVGRRVVVIGGGNVSLDAAATAKRRGADEVTLLYRRSEREMKVWKNELAEARRAGIHFRFLTAPAAIEGRMKVTGVRCVATRLSTKKDASGRRIPVAVRGSEFLIEADTVIVAIGQELGHAVAGRLERDAKGYLRVDRNYRTSAKNVFAGGDAVGGEGTIVQAVAQGKAAARAMHASLTGSKVETGPAIVAPSRPLAYDFLGLRFENPFILAAAPSTDDYEMVRTAFRMGWAGAILKTTSIEGTRVDLAYPMMSSFDHAGKRLFGMGNIDLISEHHIDVVERNVRKLKKEFPEKIVAASIMAGRKEDWQALVVRLEEAGVDFIECSFSCPQGNIGEDPGKMLAQSVKATEMTARWVKEAAKRVPVSIKITPHVTDIVETASAVKRSGADALTASNSIQALMGIDIATFVPVPRLAGRSTYSGLTGPAIKPITLRTIAEIARNVDIPILGTGGAATWSDAVEFMAVGAGVVQFCTAVMHHGFRIIDDLTSGMAHYCDRMGFASPAEIRGKALAHIAGHDGLPRRTVRNHVNEKLCIGCEACYLACRDGGHMAIDRGKNRIPHVDWERCVGCGLCEYVCPVDGAIEVYEVGEKNGRMTTKRVMPLYTGIA